jgi:hypothetical protein
LFNKTTPKVFLGSEGEANVMFKNSHGPHTFVRLVFGSMSLTYDIFTVEVHFRSDKILPLLQGMTKV